MTLGTPISSVNHTVILQAAVEDVVVKGMVHVVISMMERLAQGVLRTALLGPSTGSNALRGCCGCRVE
jgi:hypothetical protein